MKAGVEWRARIGVSLRACGLLTVALLLAPIASAAPPAQDEGDPPAAEPASDEPPATEPSPGVELTPGPAAAAEAPVAEPPPAAESDEQVPGEAAVDEPAAFVLDPAAADLLLWRSGRPDLPALSASRLSTLRGDRELALAQVTRAWSDAGAEGEAWRAWIAARLEAMSDAQDLWCATARVVGALGGYGFAEKLGFELSPGRPPERRAAAKEGLHALYGRWFASPEELAPFLGRVTGGEGTRLFLAELGREERRSNDRLLAYLETAPAEALGYLVDPDPGVRARVAPLVARTILGAQASAELVDAAYAALFERVREEPDARAFHAALEALLSLVENAPENEPRLMELRRLLVRRLAQVDVSREASIARALPRLAWRDSGLAEEGTLRTAVDELGRALERLQGDGRGGLPPDPEALVVTLQAVRDLAERAAAEDARAALRESSAHDPVFAIAVDAGRAEGTRMAAVAAMGRLVRKPDTAVLAGLLGDGSTSPRFTHALLGALRPILLEHVPGEDEARLLVNEVARLTGAEDTDLRQRALALLADPALESLVRTLDPHLLLDQLAREPSREGLLALLGLLRRVGGPALLPDLLALERFDELVAGDVQLVRELASTLDALAGRDARALLGAGRRLVSAPAPATELTRLLRALRMAARVGDAQRATLTPHDHLAIATWAYKLHAAGVSLLAEVPEGPAFLTSLAAESLPSVAQHHLTEFGEAEYAHLMGVSLALSLGEQASEEQLEAIQLDFERAIAAAGEKRLLVERVHRDRARFRLSRNDPDGARAEYAAILGSDVLDHTDLRTAAGLCGESEQPETAFDFLEHLVHRSSWRAEPAAIRMQDLGKLRAAAMRVDPVRRARLVAALDGLPEEVPKNGGEELPDALWSGLERTPEHLAALRTMCAELVAAEAAATAEAAQLVETEGAPPPDEPSPPADG